MRKSNAFHVLVLLLLASFGAHAACPLEIAHRRVGADPTYCTQDNIKAAIDSVINSCPVIIDVTREHLYGGSYCDPNDSSGCHLSISGKNITLQGRADGETCYVLTNCIPGPYCPAPSSTAPLVTLDGGDSGRVLSISGGSNVNIRNLMIAHGAPGADAGGGGIDFTGFGNLNIARSTIAFNNAGYGGGISVTGSGGTLNLRLQDYALIQNNTAQKSGGGVRIEGTARLFVLNEQTWIRGNRAVSGYGGGIEILGPARADIGSAGFYGVGVVSGNEGIDGAGIAVIDNNNGEAVLRTFADAASRPTVIKDNIGATQGGAIYLTGKADACLYATTLSGNISEYGSAISYGCGAVGADTCGESAGGVYINNSGPARLGAECGPELISALGGSTECLSGDEQCSVISGNQTQHTDGSYSPGQTVYISYGGEFVGERFRARDNTAEHVIETYYARNAARRCLITGNATTAALILSAHGSTSYVNCTIADNAVISNRVFELGNQASLELTGDIILGEPGQEPVDYFLDDGGSQNIGYIIANTTAGLPANNPSIVQAPVQFVDPDIGDYHLKPVAQTALDFGGTTTTSEDLDGNLAPVDLPTIPNLFGAADVGAFERQNLFYCGTYDSVFCSGFEH